MIRRQFIPGNTWVYYKLYCGISSSDKVILKLKTDVVSKAYSLGVITNFFFIRYKDPEYHIRLRFKLSEEQAIDRLVHLINSTIEDWVDSGIVWKVAIDSYERELERYDPRLIAIVENIFDADSKIVMGILNSSIGNNRAFRWQASIYTINKYLDYLQLSITQKEQQFAFLKNSFMLEYGVDKPTKIRMDKKYRRVKEQLVAGFTLLDGQFKEEFGVLHQYCSELVLAIQSHGMGPKFVFGQLIPSLIHMHCNRNFKSKQRTNELVIYYYIWKLYKARIARAKANNN